MYASFLEEAADRLARPAFADLAGELVEIGDGWREFALAAARMIRDRDPFDGPRLAALLRHQGQRERELFTRLDHATR